MNIHRPKDPLILSLIFTLVLLMPVHTRSEEEASRLDQAMALYKEGPSKAPQIIRLLKEELKENPKNLEAIRLLGMTYLSTEEFEKALEQFDAALSLAKKRNEVDYGTMFYKAAALHKLGLNAEAKSVLDRCWAFFQEDDQLRTQYLLLQGAIEEELKKTKKQ